jgi:hypothetical protein
MGDANIYQLGLITKLSYLPDDSEMDNLQQELNLKYRNGQANVSQVMEVCKNWQPEGKEAEDEGFEEALLKFLEYLTGGSDQNITPVARLKALRSRKTHNVQQLLHLACAAFCPDKSVVDRVTQYFRKSTKAITFYSFVAGLQDPDNGSLCPQLRLETEVNPNIKDCIAEMTENARAMGSMSLATAQASKNRARSFIMRGK